MAAVLTRRAQFLPSADPNVIPFIDVLLVLLIIFMVTAPKPTTDLRVDLPRSGPTAPAPIPPTIVSVRADGQGVRYFIDAEEVDRAGLAQAALGHMLAADPALSAGDVMREGRLFVRADLDVAYQNVVSAVDDLQHAGFRRVAIVAQDADAP